MATKTFRLLPPWRVLLKTFFEPCLLNGAEFTFSVAKNVALFEAVRIVRCKVLHLSNGVTGDWITETNDGTVLFLIEKMNQINTKNYWKEKRLCVRLRSGDRHHLRKSADRKAQIRKAFVAVTALICAFRSADFLRWCLSPSATSRTISFFYFQ